MSQSSNNLIRHHTAKFSVKTQCNSALEFPPEERETNKKGINQYKGGESILGSPLTFLQKPSKIYIISV
jgi:hypothetical protein